MYGSCCNLILMAIMVKFDMIFGLSKVSWALNRYVLRNLHSISLKMAYLTYKCVKM